MPGQQARDYDGQRAGHLQRRGEAVGDGDQASVIVSSNAGSLIRCSAR
jgi:hypothetical protein